MLTPVRCLPVRTPPDSWDGRLPPSLVKELSNGGAGGASGGSSVIRSLQERPSMDDCLWCSLGEGSVDDCVCGNRVCYICAMDEVGDCVCGMHMADRYMY